MIRFRQRMPGPGDDRNLIDEQMFLDHVVDRRRFAQRPQQQVDIAVPQRVQQHVVRAVPDLDAHAGNPFLQSQDRLRQDDGAAQRQRPHVDLRVQDSLCRLNVDDGLLDLLHRQPEIPGQLLPGVGHPQAASGPFVERRADEIFEVA